MNAIANSHQKAIWVERQPGVFNAQSSEQSDFDLPHSERVDVGAEFAAAHGKRLLSACSDDGDTRADQWLDGVYNELPSAAAGGVLLFHFSQQASVLQTAPFDVIRFGISQDALEEIANNNGFKRTEELRLQMSGGHDSVLHGLAQALAPAIERPEQIDTLFVDHIAIAFFIHVTSTYGRSSASGDLRLYGLAPWQLRRAKDRMCMNIEGDPTLASLAQDCGLSPSQFSRAFKQTTGTTPHQWLTRKRIERAKELLHTGDLELAEIGLACGFHDQSHFTRVFAQSEGCAPGKWRRLRRA